MLALVVSTWFLRSPTDNSLVLQKTENFQANGMGHGFQNLGQSFNLLIFHKTSVLIILVITVIPDGPM